MDISILRESIQQLLQGIKDGLLGNFHHLSPNTKAYSYQNESHQVRVISLQSSSVSFNLANMSPDYVNLLPAQIQGEIVKFITTQIVDDVSSTSNIAYLNLGRLDSLSQNEIDKLGRQLIFTTNQSTGYYLVAGKMGYILQSASRFSSNKDNLVRYNASSFTFLGELFNYPCYVNNQIPFNDNRIFSFRDLHIGLRIDDLIEVINPQTMRTDFRVIFTYFAELVDPSVIYYIEDNQSPGYDLFLSEFRDKKIDQILDGH